MKNSLTVPVLILLLLVMGCSALRDMGRQAEQNTEETAETTQDDTAGSHEEKAGFTPGHDPKSDIAEMSKRFMDETSFQAKMTGKGSVTMESAVDFVAPDRFRISTNAIGGQYVEMIVIGKQSYMNLGGKWQKMPAMDLSSIAGVRQAFTEEGMKWVEDVRLEGEETVDGKPAYVYTYKGKSPGVGPDFSSKLWVAKADGLPIKITADYGKGELKSMEINYNYDARISIEAPIQ